MFHLCSHCRMERIAPSRLPAEAIADALLAAPGWARVGLAAPTEHMRQQAAKELAIAVLEGSETGPEVSPDQLALGL